MVEETMFLGKIWNHPVETTIKDWLFKVPGIIIIYYPSSHNHGVVKNGSLQ